VLGLPKVRVAPTSLIGWDQHPIWSYEADLMDAHLDHGIAGISEQNGFFQKPGEVYWISIQAFVGHRPELVTDPATGEVRWVAIETGKFANEHYWGWHTSPFHFNDVATMGMLAMPNMNWEFFGWQRIQPQHMLVDMAFQLKTFPEPGSMFLAALAMAGSALAARRRRP
jgi:hypothetical protein